MFKERRKSERSLFKTYGAVGLIVATVCACLMHTSVAKQGLSTVEQRASSEASLIVALTKGFVETYTDYTGIHQNAKLPNPAIFRADALKQLEESRINGNTVSTGVVGLPGREIAQAAKDENMRQLLLKLEASPSTNMLSAVLEDNERTTYRSVWAFPASSQGCADCHNRLQNLNGDKQWKVGDLMGAQMINQDISAQVARAHKIASVQCILVFIATLTMWFLALYMINQFRLNKKLKLLAVTDPLTGCINRRELHERILQLKGPTNGALLMLDLDNFKRINDTFGHAAGDERLKHFNEKLRVNFRKEDWISRYGGEEFVVWIPDIKPSNAIRAAERLRSNIENSSIVVNGETIKYTVSIGLQIIKNAQASRFENWINTADAQLYQAKSEGRNRIICEVNTDS